MPQVTVYIRKDDLPKWEALEKKSEFIHGALKQSKPREIIELCKHGAHPATCKFAKYNSKKGTKWCE